MIQAFWRSVFLPTLLLSVVNAAPIEDGLDGANGVLDSMRQARTSIRNGSFGATVLTVVKDKNGVRSSWQTEINAVFDYSIGGLHWASCQNRQVGLRSSEEFSGISRDDLIALRRKVGDDAEEKQIVFEYVRNNEYAAEWYGIGAEGVAGSATSGGLNIRPPDTISGKQFANLIDVRSLGSLIPREEAAGSKFLQKHQAWLRDTPATVLVEESKIVVTYSADTFKRQYVLNTDRGLTCEQLELYELDEIGEQKAMPRSTVRTTWQEFRGEWVPGQVQYKDVYHDGSEREIKWTLAWAKLNSVDIPSQEFTYSAMGEVWDGEPIREWRADARGEEIGTVGEPEQKTAVPSVTHSAPAALVFWWLLLGGTSLFLLWQLIKRKWRSAAR